MYFTVKFINNNPFIKLAFYWIAGILIGQYAPQLSAVVFLLLLFFGGWALVLRKKQRYPFQLIYSTTLGLLLVALSLGNTQIRQVSIPTPPDDKIYFSATLLEKPIEKTNSYQLLVRINEAEEEALDGQKLLCWTSKHDSIAGLFAGDQFVTRAKINRVTNRGNPFEFDYAGYLEQQEIFFQCFINAQSVKQHSQSKRGFFAGAENYREILLNKIRSNVSSPESFQVIAALTLGYRKELQVDTKSYFTQTGAMHVLAVSGLHVGLIYLFLVQLTRVLQRNRAARILRFILIFGTLWFYAWITGLSPSVLRASTMFSFLLAAESTNRRSSTYNTIAASAFFLLVLQPKLIFEVGFQLSYCAILSIIFFYPILEKAYPAGPAIFRKAWQLLCISIAAQIGTFPLSIFYFNQFPTYFWLSNFIVMPAAFIILLGTFLLLLTAIFPVISQFIGQILDYVTQLVIDLLRQVSALPGALTEHISIGGWQLFFTLLAVVFVVLALASQKGKYLLWATGCIIAFLLIDIQLKIQLSNQQQLIVYNTNHQCIQIINGRENFILTSDPSKTSPYLYRNVQTKLRLKPPQIVQINDVLAFESEAILVECGLLQLGNFTFYLDDLYRTQSVHGKLISPGDLFLTLEEQKQTLVKLGNSVKANGDSTN